MERRGEHGLGGVGDAAERLIDGVAVGVDRQVANLVLVDQEGMCHVDRRAHLCEAGAGVEAAVHVDVERRDVVIGDAHLGRLVGGDPFAVIERNRGAGDVLGPGLPAILARAHRDIRQAQGRDVHVVDTVRVRLRRRAQVRVAAPRRHSAGGLGDLVRGVQRRVMQPAIGRFPGERAGGETELGRDVERPRGVGANGGLRGAVAAARRARTYRPRRGAEREVHERERPPARRPGCFHAAVRRRCRKRTRVAGGEQQDGAESNHAGLHG